MTRRPTRPSIIGHLKKRPIKEAARQISLARKSDTDTGWIAMSPLAVNFTPHGNGPAPRYRRLNGVVYLQGYIVPDGANFNGKVFFTLPVGFRPTVTLRFSGVGGNTANGWQCDIDVGANGDVAFWYNTVANAQFTIDMVHFPIG